jgi:CheY-like chemotaxis protein
MSIAYELAQLMSGRIEIESKKNQGTDVHIYLNLVKVNNNNNNNNNNNLDLENISILLVEDNAINRLVAQKSLENHNCTIVEANNGKHCIEILKTQQFDIILMDIFMPEMDGVEATKIIRNEMKITTPIIAFTANAFKSEIKKFIEIGMDDYVIKPFDETILIETIAKHTTDKEDFIRI